MGARARAVGGATPRVSRGATGSVGPVLRCRPFRTSPMPVSLDVVLTFVFVFCVCTPVCQDDNTGTGGVEGERQLVHPLSRFEIARIAAPAKQRVDRCATSPFEWIVLRKLQLQQVPFALSLDDAAINAIHYFGRRDGGRVSSSAAVGSRTAVAPPDVPPSAPVPPAMLDALRAIQTTRYEHSFAARVYGHTPQEMPGLIAVDWESHSPWTLLMGDICTHYALAQSVDVFIHLRAFVSPC